MTDWGYYPVADVESRTSAGRRKPSRHVGRTTRLGIEQYQDYTLYNQPVKGGEIGSVA